MTHLVTTDQRTRLRRGTVRHPDGQPPQPSGCRWCGTPQRHHGRSWVAAAGLHQWVQPTPAQILARMKARLRASRSAR